MTALTVIAPMAEETNMKDRRTSIEEGLGRKKQGVTPLCLEEVN